MIILRCDRCGETEDIVNLKDSSDIQRVKLDLNEADLCSPCRRAVAAVINEKLTNYNRSNPAKQPDGLV